MNPILPAAAVFVMGSAFFLGIGVAFTWMSL